MTITLVILLTIIIAIFFVYKRFFEERYVYVSYERHGTQYYLYYTDSKLEGIQTKSMIHTSSPYNCAQELINSMNYQSRKRYFSFKKEV